MSNTLSNREKYVSLVTFRRDGTAVPSPVWFAAMGDEFGVITETNVGKVKRIRSNPRVTVQVCDMSGNVSNDAPVLSATARLVTGDEAVRVRKAVGKKYGPVYVAFSVYWTVTTLWARLRGRDKHDPETAILFRLTASC
ncbi:MAG: PPOX class F420-dependent oxidoreductase [Ilumatobacteraceae bacterium]